MASVNTNNLYADKAVNSVLSVTGYFAGLACGDIVVFTGKDGTITAAGKGLFSQVVNGWFHRANGLEETSIFDTVEKIAKKALADGFSDGIRKLNDSNEMGTLNEVKKYVSYFVKWAEQENELRKENKTPSLNVSSLQALAKAVDDAIGSQTEASRSGSPSSRRSDTTSTSHSSDEEYCNRAQTPIAAARARAAAAAAERAEEFEDKQYREALRRQQAGAEKTRLIQERTPLMKEERVLLNNVIEGFMQKIPNDSLKAVLEVEKETHLARVLVLETTASLETVAGVREDVIGRMNEHAMRHYLIGHSDYNALSDSQLTEITNKIHHGKMNFSQLKELIESYNRKSADDDSNVGQVPEEDSENANVQSGVQQVPIDVQEAMVLQEAAVLRTAIKRFVEDMPVDDASRRLIINSLIEMKNAHKEWVRQNNTASYESVQEKTAEMVERMRQTSMSEYIDYCWTNKLANISWEQMQAIYQAIADDENITFSDIDQLVEGAWLANLNETSKKNMIFPTN